jgi:hypothetical protein
MIAVTEDQSRPPSGLDETVHQSSAALESPSDAALQQLNPRRVNLDPTTIRNLSPAEMASLIGVH